MDDKKVLVVCQGYYKSTVIRRMLPWDDLGYHLIIGLNSYYSISAIRKIDPDVLIVVDYMPGQTIGAVLETYRHAASSTRIILVPYEQNVVSAEDQKAFQVISWDELTGDTLAKALDTIFAGSDGYDSGIFPEVSEADPFKATTEKYARREPSFPVLPIRALFRDAPSGNAKKQAERVMRNAVNAIGSGQVLEDAGGDYCLLIEVPTNILSDGFWKLNAILEDLQNRLCHIGDTAVVLFLGEIVGNRQVPQEYENLVSLEPYAFFHSHHGIQSATFIQRHTLNNDVPMAEVAAMYIPLLKALLRNEEQAVRETLEEIYLRQVKLHQNMALYRLVRSQLLAIYSCACSINDAMTPELVPEEHFWSIEEALEDQIRRFTAHFPVEENHRPLGKLTTGALELILQQYDRPIYATAIADRLGVTEAHLSRTFKKELGIGITECIRTVRIYMSAMDLLEDCSSIRDVAQKHGFEDPKYYNKVFRKIMGQSPSEWIRQQREESAV